MSILYLVRHGQAGTRENYDSLSELGHRQARLLRDYFAARNIVFETAYCGTLARQRATAREVLPDVEILADPGWDEFDLDHVYSEYAPRLSAADEVFRREFEDMQEQVAASQGAHDAPVHRRWNDCDRTVVRAWVEARYEYSGESWSAFQERIGAALQRIAAAGHSGNTVVFTSATPIGICAARTLEIFDGRAMQLAGVMLNTSFSTLRIRENEIRLFSFNTTPHLDEPHLKTFR